MMSGLKELFLNNLSFIRDLFKKHVVAQGNTGGITSVSEAEAYFANYIRRERPTRLFLEEGAGCKKNQSHSRPTSRTTRRPANVRIAECPFPPMHRRVPTDVSLGIT